MRGLARDAISQMSLARESDRVRSRDWASRLEKFTTGLTDQRIYQVRNSAVKPIFMP